MRGGCRRFRRRRPHRGERRHQQRHPVPPKRRSSVRASSGGPTNSSGSAPGRNSTRSPSFSTKRNMAGYWAHAYRFEPETSTFIVECSEATWRGLGFERAGTEEAIAICERIFAPHLERPQADEQCAPSARLGVAEFSGAQLRALAQRQDRADRRRCALRAFLRRFGHQACSRRRERACLFGA